MANKFFLYFDHQAFKYLQSKKRLTNRHVAWVEFFQTFTFVLRHRSGEDNKVVDALSHVANLLHTLNIQVLGFDRIKSIYSSYPDFGIIYQDILDSHYRNHVNFVIHDGYFFRGVLLCIPRTLFQDLLVREMHVGGLAGHLGRDKTITLDEDRVYWPSLKKDVAKIVS